MTVGIPLQVQWFVDVDPGWLPPTLLFFGIFFVLLGATQATFPQLGVWNHATARQRTVSEAGFVLGMLFVSVGALKEFGLVGLYGVFLFTLGRSIEGIAAVHFYKKIWALVTKQRTPGGISKRVLYHGTGLAITGGFGWLLVRIFSGGVGTGDVELLLLSWTAYTGVMTAFGLWWRFHDVDVHPFVKAGMILAVTGAELYNHAFVLDVAASTVGSLGYAFGVYLGIYYFFRK